MKKYFLLIILLLILLSSCCPCRKLVTSIVEKTTVRDSIIERIKDTTIYVAVEKVVTKDAVVLPDSSRLENKFSISTAKVKGNILYHALEQKNQSLPIQIKYVDKYHEIVRDNVVTKVEVIEVNKLNKWQSFRLVLGNIFGVLLIGLVGYVAFKIYRKIKL